ncbi:Dynein axonemal heavy chain 1, partial [Aduncisulcus paluster]
EIFQIEISKSYGIPQWHEDLKNVLQMAGLKRKPTVFLFNDTQLFNESQLEDLNNILNTGDVPTIYEPPELENIYNTMRPICQAEGKPLTKVALFQTYLSRVRNNLHVVLCMSPVGEAFRTRLRKFPSFVNCCTIDWFTGWPEEALRSVGADFVSEMLISDDIQKTIVDSFVYMHRSVEKLSVRYKKETNRSTHITPTSFLELLKLFSKLIEERSTYLTQQRRRYDAGLEKLAFTAKLVAKLQSEQEELKPRLEKQGIEVKQMAARLQIDKAKASKKQKEVEEDKKKSDASAKEAADLEKQCKDALSLAEPLVKNAEKKLKNLSKAAITEVQSMRTPPVGVRRTMEAVLIMLKKQPKGSGDWWPESKRVLGSAGFVKSLQQFKKNDIPAAVIARVKPYTDDPDFEEGKILASSLAASNLCGWVHAMVTYNREYQRILPLRASLAKAEEKCAIERKNLALKEAELDAVSKKLADLNAQHAAAEERHKALLTEASICDARLKRASSLMNGLGGEKDRWTRSSAILGNQLERVYGDVALSCGIISYLGP